MGDTCFCASKTLNKNPETSFFSLFVTHGTTAKQRVVISGSRDWTDEDAIHQQLLRFSPQDTIIVHGGCRGADMIADRVAKSMGFAVECYPAEWNKYGKAAGPIRNSLMLEISPPPVHLLAFPLPQSRGTIDAIHKAQAKGITVTISTKPC